MSQTQKSRPGEGGSRKVLPGPIGTGNHSTAADRLLSRLEGVRSRGPGSWIARCPAHPDRSPSLSIRETSDGTVLLKCFSGCGAADIVAAVGLSLGDLFPPRPAFSHTGQRPGRPAFPWRDFAEATMTTLTALCLALRDLAAGVPIAESDRDFLTREAERLLGLIESTEVRHG